MADTAEQPQLDPDPRQAGASGDRDAIDRMLPVIYEELRRIAHYRLRAEQTGHTLETTGLVHEAYLRLAGSEHLEYESRAHFLAIAAQAMRHILIDSALARRAQKRGGGVQTLSIDAVPIVAEERSEEVLALDEALQRLGAINARQARVVECRFFGGMNIEDTAVALDLSTATVKRDWTLARAWLNRELQR
ncbi:MAG: ECF-type sigma factor [Gemmatimonadota bacterium]|nr:ECF-type sigma factor [Gemmatimonadota bacterium]